MNPRTITKERNGLRVVTRELFGRDRATETLVRGYILNAVYPRLGFKTPGDLPNAHYTPMIGIAQIIVQTVSLEEVEGSDAHWPDNLVLPSPSNPSACVAFYDSLMDLPDWYLSFLLEGVEAINAEAPNLNGGNSAKKSASVLVSASTSTAEKQQTPIPAHG